MKTIALGLSLLLTAAWSSCTPEKMNVKFVFTNASTHPLNWVTLEVGKGEFTAGVLPQGVSKTELDVNWSSAPKDAKLTFIDDTTRQKYSIPISLTNVNEQVRLGKCRAIVLRILDYDKAEIVCQ